MPVLVYTISLGALLLIIVGLFIMLWRQNSVIAQMHESGLRFAKAGTLHEKVSADVQEQQAHDAWKIQQAQMLKKLQDREAALVENKPEKSFKDKLMRTGSAVDENGEHWERL